MSNPKMPDLGALMAQAQKLQADMAKMQEELARIECEGTAGGGLVTATMNGQFEVVRIKLDRSVVDPSDVGMLEDLIAAAVNAAAVKAKETTKQHMAKVMGPFAAMGSIAGLPPGLF